MRGKRFICLSGEERLVWDADPEAVARRSAGIAGRARNDGPAAARVGPSDWRIWKEKKLGTGRKAGLWPMAEAGRSTLPGLA
jgi:hypothetical protein